MTITVEEVCVFILLILAVETIKVSCGLCQFQQTEDSMEDYATDLTLRKAVRANKKCNVDWSRTYYTEDDGYIVVDCGRCSVYNLHVSAKRNTQHDPIVCSGLTPQLFTSKLDCMWKKTCILRYSPATIVWSLPNQEPTVPNCVGEAPGTIDVRYSCLDSEIQVESVMKGFQAIDSLLGLVRSHNYVWGNRIVYPKYKNRFVMNISPPADIIISGKNYFILLYVVTSNISVGMTYECLKNNLVAKEIFNERKVQGDKLIIYDSNGTDECEVVTTWEVDYLHNISSTLVHLEFLLNTTSRPSLGFDICFQWFDVENVKASRIFSQTVEHCKRAMKTKNNAFPTFEMIKDKSSQGYKGFVRSHSKYPWNYPRENVNFQFVKTWSSEEHVLQAPSNLRHVRIQVVALKLAARDRLQIINGHLKVSGLELLKTQKYEFQGQSVTFNFSVRRSSDQTDAGFLLCYQWYTPEQDNLTTELADLCSSFTYNVHPCGKSGKRLLKDKCGLWKKTKGSGKKQQIPKTKHRKGRT